MIPHSFHFAIFSADIPFFKLRNPTFNKFLKKYTGVSVSETTVRNGLPQIYGDLIDELRKVAKNNYIWVSVDETIDCEMRSIVNFVFGVLSGTENKTAYLLNVESIEKCNHSTIAKFFNDCLTLLYPNGII